MKIAVCIAPPAGDCYGHLTRYGKQLRSAAAERGMEVELLKYGDANFFPRLFANLADESCLIHFYGFLYDLRISTSLLPDDVVYAVETASAATIATIGDHPFAPFMRDAVRMAHPKTKFIVMDQAFPDEMQVINPELRKASYDYQPVAPPTNYESKLQTDFGERDLDLLIPMWVVDMKDRDIAHLLSGIKQEWFADAIVATYETAMRDTKRSPFHIFIEHMRNRLGDVTLHDIREKNPNALNSVLKAIAAIDSIVRQERRQKMISSLLNSIGNLRIAITSDPIPSMHVDKNVQFLGLRHINEIVNLMANARAILNTNPTYPSSIHERIISGMMYESCVITDVNQYMRDAFEGAEFVAYSPDSSLTIQDIFTDFDVRGIAAAGASRIRSDPVHSWDAHIDGLMRVAAAA